MEVNAYLVWGDLVSGFLETGIPKQDLKPKLASIELWFKKKKKKNPGRRNGMCKSPDTFLFPHCIVRPSSLSWLLSEKGGRETKKAKVCPKGTVPRIHQSVN